MDHNGQHQKNSLQILPMASSGTYSDLVDTAPSSSSVLFKKRSVSERILEESNGNGDPEEDFEAAHLLEQTKKLKITTVPGILLSVYSNFIILDLSS